MSKKKTVFISASSSGIGFYLAKQYKSLNYNVVINGTNKLKLKKISKVLLCDFFLGDLTQEKKIKSLVKKLKKNYGYIDLLICNLGSSNFSKNNKDLQNAFKYNFFSTTTLVENSKRILKNSKSKIIWISSICGIESIEGAPLGYSLAKSALNFYIKLISKDLAKKKVSINGIIPGNILFPNSTWEFKLSKNKKKIKKYISQNVPMNEFGSVNDIFNICKMLSENDSYFMTGSLIKLDGGQTKSI